MANEKARSGGWNQIRVQCPFWRGENPTCIICEGPSFKETLRRRFPNKEAKTAMFRRYCCTNYKDCCVYKLVYSCYEERDLATTGRG